VSPRLALATTTLPVVRVGRTFGVSVRTTGGVGPVTLRVISGRFPVGVRLLTNSGRIRGKPRKAGVYRITIEGRDALGVSVRRTFGLTVRSAGR
ncbi:MAG TPA: Ig domain-containing protein, partial [Gaiellaceae bacterium]|nr:Ig domain-containing protein [Gaiellaceae bacterium]